MFMCKMYLHSLYQKLLFDSSHKKRLFLTISSQEVCSPVKQQVMNKGTAIFTRSCKHWEKEINVKECRRAIAYVSMVLSKRAKGLDAWELAIPVCAVVKAQRC